jgi:hypothetical protein
MGGITPSDGVKPDRLVFMFLRTMRALGVSGIEWQVGGIPITRTFP